MLSYKINPKAANLIAEALDADERTERFLRQMIPSIGLQGKVADEDYEAPHKAMQRAAPKRGGERRNKDMSEKEKALAEKVCALPPELQEKFVQQIDGAALAVEYMQSKKKDEKEAG